MRRAAKRLCAPNKRSSSPLKSPAPPSPALGAVVLRCSSVEYARYAPFSRLAHDADCSPTAAPLFFNGLLARVLHKQTASRPAYATTGLLVPGGLVEALDDPESLGKRVLILDETGAHLPFALAEILAKARVDVEIMSQRMFAGERIYRNLDMLYIFPRLKQLGVKITHQHFVEAIRAGEVDVYDIWAGAEAVEKRTGVESVVLSILRVPNDGLYFEAQGLFPDVSRIGDVAAPRDVAAVLVDGETLGRAL